MNDFKSLCAGRHGADYALPMPAGRPFRVLQMTDTQTVDMSAARNATRWRQYRNAYLKDGIFGMEERCYVMMRDLVARTDPDLIVLTGDNVYGEFDDNGTRLLEMIDLMESFGKPWTTVFGNHDNESRVGVRWQCDRYEQAPHSLFRRGNVTGNSNGSILLTDGERDVFTLVMMDTNMCRFFGNPAAPEEGLLPSNADYDLLVHESGIFADQQDWYEKTVGNTPNAVFLHIMPAAFLRAAEERYGYVFGKSFGAHADGDFGEYVEQMKETEFVDPDGTFFELARTHHCRAIFAGHQHRNNAVLSYRGVRLGYGLKTGYTNGYRPGATGGTLHLVFPDGTMTSSHVFHA